jgi:hypothetical protein
MWLDLGGRAGVRSAGRTSGGKSGMPGGETPAGQGRVGGGGCLSNGGGRRVHGVADCAGRIIGRRGSGRTDGPGRRGREGPIRRRGSSRGPYYTVGVSQPQRDKRPEVDQREHRAPEPPRPVGCQATHPEGQREHLPPCEDRIFTTPFAKFFGWVAMTVQLYALKLNHASTLFGDSQICRHAAAQSWTEMIKTKRNSQREI